MIAIMDKLRFSQKTIRIKAKQYRAIVFAQLLFSFLLSGCDNKIWKEAHSTTYELAISDGFFYWQDSLIWLDHNGNGQLDDNEQVLEGEEHSGSFYSIPNDYDGVIAAKNRNLEGAYPRPIVLTSLPLHHYASTSSPLQTKIIISPLSSAVMKSFQQCDQAELIPMKALFANAFSNGDLEAYEEMTVLEQYKGRVFSIISTYLLEPESSLLNEMVLNDCQSIPHSLSTALNTLPVDNSEIITLIAGGYIAVEASDSDQDGALNPFDVAPYNASLKADIDNDNIADELEEELGFDTSNNDRDELFAQIALTGDIDSDSDGLPDLYEVAFGWGATDANTPRLGSSGDDDADDLTNLEELTLKTSPLLKDSDDDGLNDGVEHKLGWDVLVANTGTQQATSDFDGDGLSNLEEQTLGTALNNADSDGDGLSDYNETRTQNQVDEAEKANWSPLIENSGVYAKLSDFDGDGLTNGQEAALRTSLVEMDSDGDGITDYHEVIYYWDPLDAQIPQTSDFDSDGLSNIEELYTYGTDPESADTDGDGLFDALEVTLNWDPLVENSGDQSADGDFDGDGLSNVTEVNLGTALNAADSDGDGVSDGQETLQGSNPLDQHSSTPQIDTDNDGLYDVHEDLYGWDKGVPNSPVGGGSGDADNDGLTNQYELEVGTDPTVADTDSDGINDVFELTYHWDPVDASSPAQGGAGDADNDGVSNADEVLLHQTNPTLSDSDGDGLTDGDELHYGWSPTSEVSPEGGAFGDADNDGLFNLAEIALGLNPIQVDTDGDGWSDSIEVEQGWDGLDAASPGYHPGDDTDNDGLSNLVELGLQSNYLSSDSDDDGLNDGVEHELGWDVLVANTGTQQATSDFDGDGLSNLEEQTLGTALDNADSDGDEITDNLDAFPLDGTESVDTDSDGIGNNADPDDDNDGVADESDAYPLDATETLDTDGDGVGDNADAFPSDATETLDTDGDGVGDNADAFPSDATETLDTDGDGVGDNADAFPTDATEKIDTDGDGVGDNADAFPSDASETLDTDGDGVGDNADAFPSDASETLDTDGDGVGDNADVLASFNLSSIEASAGATKTAVFTWKSASEESGITYTVCKKDTVQDNNCDILTSVVDGNSTAILLGNLYKAAGAEYFILASKDSQLQLSNEVSIDNTELNAMIGFLKASSPEASAQFGHTVVLSSDGDTLAVGAPSENSGGIAGSGAVYIYSQAAGVWSLSQRLDADYDNPSSNTSSRIKSNALFGSSLSLSGDGKVLAVGANAEGDSGSRYGAAYVFSESSSVWSLNQRLEAVNLENYAYFGQSVSLTEDGKWLAVGAYKEDKAATNSGAAYVFSESGGVWALAKHLSPSESGGTNYFGSSVSFSGDGSTLAVGAYGETVDSKSQAGAVYVFSAPDYDTSQRLDAGSYAESSAYFGRVVSLSESGQTLAVGAENEGSYAGAVYVFSESGGVWSSPQRIVASNGESFDSFGYSVSLSGDGNTLVVGAYREDGAGNGVSQLPNDDQAFSDGAGAAYVYSLISGDWSEQAYLKSLQTDPSSHFGISISTNGESTVVGAYREAVDEKTEAGAVYVF